MTLRQKSLGRTNKLNWRKHKLKISLNNLRHLEQFKMMIITYPFLYIKLANNMSPFAKEKLKIKKIKMQYLINEKMMVLFQ